MEKRVLFDTLCAEGFTQEDAREYFALQEQYRTNVETPLALAYFDGNEFSVLPYIDRENLENLWGIVLNGNCVVSLKDWGTKENYASSLRVADFYRLGDKSLHLFPAIALTAEFVLKFNETVRHLRYNDIPADFLEGCYWTRNSSRDYCNLNLETEREIRAKSRTNPYTTATQLCVGKTGFCKETNTCLEKKVRLCADL